VKCADFGTASRVWLAHTTATGPPRASAFQQRDDQSGVTLATNLGKNMTKFRPGKIHPKLGLQPADRVLSGAHH
jgi:hypothetical protein